jgi:uncharacterized membrane protein
MANKKETWHDDHVGTYNFGNKLADSVAKRMGSWSFIIIQTIFVILVDDLKFCWVYVSLGRIPFYLT